MGDQGRGGAIGRGEMLTLLQWSAAETWAGAVGSLALTAGSGRGRRPRERGRRRPAGLRHDSGLLRASVRITAQRAMPERSVEPLCLLGGFLALRELQAEVDAGAAVGGIVATGAG
jgi:hypothetical protein